MIDWKDVGFTRISSRYPDRDMRRKASCQRRATPSELVEKLCYVPTDGGSTRRPASSSSAA